MQNYKIKHTMFTRNKEINNLLELSYMYIFIAINPSSFRKVYKTNT